MGMMSFILMGTTRMQLINTMTIFMSLGSNAHRNLNISSTDTESPEPPTNTVNSVGHTQST